MAYLLRRRIAELEEKVKGLETELSEWHKIGDRILKIFHRKEIGQLLKGTLFYLLMARYKENQATEWMIKELNKNLFGDKS